MKAVLKSFDCFDHDPIDQWHPDDPACVDYCLCLHIGTEEEEGADLFYVHVLTESAVRALSGAEAKMRKKIVLSSYSWSAVLHSIEKILVSVEGRDWSSLSGQLSEHFSWEFENYKAG